MLKLVDKLVRNFKIDGFLPAFIIAIAVAVVLALVGWSRNDERNETSQLQQPTQTELLVALK